MPASTISIRTDLRRDLTIKEIKSTIVDVPTVRKHKLSSLSVTAQSYVIVELRLANGVDRYWRSGNARRPALERGKRREHQGNDRYLSRARADRFGGGPLRAAAGSAWTKLRSATTPPRRAIESALFDAVGKTLDVPAVQLLGGVVREACRCCGRWRPAILVQEIEEAERKIAARLHNTFKVKIGAQAPTADMARLRRLAVALDGRATLIVDANQAWDETTALRCLPVLG